MTDEERQTLRRIFRAMQSYRRLARQFEAENERLKLELRLMKAELNNLERRSAW